MKRITLLALALILLALCACGTPTTVDPTDEPYDTSPLTGTETASPSAAPSASPSAGASATAGLSASPSPSPSAGSASATVPPATDFAELDLGYTMKTSLKKAASSSQYVVLCTVSVDKGARNILTGTDLGAQIPNAVISNWEYTIKIDEVLKNDSSAKISAGDELLCSMPFEIKMKKDKPLARELSFAQLFEGKQYVLFIEYNDVYEFYTFPTFDPSKFLVENGVATYISGITDYADIWKTITEGKDVTVEDIRSACK